MSELREQMVHGFEAILWQAGQQATYRQEGQGVYDPDSGDYIPATPILTPVTVLLGGFEARELVPDQILQSDRWARMLQSALATAPDVNDTIDIGGVVWDVLAIADDVSTTTWEFHLREQGV